MSADPSVLATVAATAARQRHDENFPVALRVIPSQPRGHLVRLYAYARFVDDLGDEAPGDRLALLDAVAADVAQLDGGSPQLAPVAGLVPVRAATGLPLQPLLDLVEANRRDQRVPTYETFDELLDYCRLSAAPIGRMVLAVAGVGDPELERRSDAVCAGLQVLEHCQDVAEDAARGRIYLPGTELRAAGVEPAQLLGDHTPAALRAVVGRQVDRAEALLDEGRPLVRALRGWARVAVAGYLAGGRATVAALRAADHDVVAREIRPGKGRTVAEALRAVVRP